MAPSPMIEPNRPYSPEPRPNPTVAMSESERLKLKPKVPMTKPMASSTLRSNRTLTYLTPSRTLDFPWTGGEGCSWSARNMIRVVMNPMKQATLMTMTHPVPIPAMSRPATPGPRMRAPLKEALLRLMALGSFDSGTISETNACIAGL